MASKFTYRVKSDPKTIFKMIKERIEVSGNDKAGVIKKSGVKLRYTMNQTKSGTTLTAEILSKPFYISNGKVESELDKLETQINKKLAE